MLAHGRDARFVAGLCQLMCVTADRDKRSDYAAESIDFDDKIACDFRRLVLVDLEFSQQLRELSEYFDDRRRTKTHEIQASALSLVSELRKRLARVCLDALEPDLVILDEFQRFPRSA